MNTRELAWGGYGIVSMCSLLLGLFSTSLFRIPIVQGVCAVGILIGAALILLSSLRRPGRLIGSLILASLIAIVCFGVTYGLVWYFVDYLPSTGEPLIKF